MQSPQVVDFSTCLLFENSVIGVHRRGGVIAEISSVAYK